MNYTNNYKLPLYEGSDPTSYLTTYNETMEKIDESLHALALKVATGEVNDRQFTSDISAIKGRLDSAESLIETLTTELGTTNGNVGKNTDDIKTLKNQLVEQGTLIKNLRSEVSALETSFESFKTAQEQKNNAYEGSLFGLSAELSNASKKQELKNTEFTSAIAKSSDNPTYHTCFHKTFSAVTSGSQLWDGTYSINLGKKFTEKEYENIKFSVLITKNNMDTIKNTCLVCGEYTNNPTGFNADRNFEDGFTFSIEIKFKSDKTVSFKISGVSTEQTEWTINTDIIFSVD